MIELDSSLTSNGFPIADINDIAGGNMYFNTLEERDSLDSSFIKEGMFCYVENKTYRYMYGKWEEVSILTKEQFDSILQRINLIETGIKIEGIVLNSYSLLLNKDDIFKLEAKLVPETDLIKPVFTIEDNTIASIDSDGNIKALKKGKTTIFVTIPNPNIKAVCELHVSDSGIVGIEDLEEGPLCKLVNANFGNNNSYWEDSSGNEFNAKLINFSEDPFSNNCIQLRGKEYIELSGELMSEGVSTIELYIDPLLDSFPEKKMLFAKKDSWNSMCYQISNQDIMFGGINGIERISSITNIDGLHLFTFTINRIDRRIDIFVDGNYKESVLLTESQFGDNAVAKLLIGTHSEVDSSSNLDIYAIKIFNRILTREEIKQEYNNLKI